MLRQAIRRVAVYAESSQVDAASAKKVCNLLAQALGANKCKVDVGLMRLDNLILPAGAVGADPSLPKDHRGASCSGAEFNMHAQADALVFMPRVDWGALAEPLRDSLLPVESSFGRFVVRMQRDAQAHVHRRVPVLVLLLPAPAEIRAELPRRVRPLAAHEAAWRAKISSFRRRQLLDSVLTRVEKDAQLHVSALFKTLPNLKEIEKRYIKEYVLPELGARVLARARELRKEETMNNSIRRLPKILRENLVASLPAHLRHSENLIAAVVSRTRTLKEARVLRKRECVRGIQPRAALRATRHDVQSAFHVGPAVRVRLLDLCLPMLRRAWTRRPTETALAPVADALLKMVCGRKTPEVSDSSNAARHPEAEPQGT